MPKYDFNHTFAWVFSCKFAAYFQNAFKNISGWLLLKIMACLATQNFQVLHVNNGQTFSTSKKIPSSRAYDINRGSIIAFRENGKGHNGLESPCSSFNLVPPGSFYKALE